MKFITKDMGITRNETMARTTYHAMLEISVSDIEIEEGIDITEIPSWIIDNYPYLVHSILGYEYGNDECNCGDDHCD